MNCVPKHIAKHVKEITKEFLKEQGIKGLIIDVDNTLAHHGINEVEEEVVNWIEELKQEGFKLMLVSNNKEERVYPIGKILKVKHISSAYKPRKKAYEIARKEMGLKLEEIAGVGDQIFSDVWGANRAGCYSILVSPLHVKEILLIKVKRGAEKIFIKKYYKRKGKK